MTPDEALRADIVDIRCLNLCIGMLERVHGVSTIPFPTCCSAVGLMGVDLAEF
jgi:hypothetical protein